jgi:ketosteroid isomerase-like protein
MHPNEALIRKLFDALNRHDHQSMADCYRDDATFGDIAFDLKGRREIHAMWHMICSGDIKTTVEAVEATGSGARASIVDVYTFRETGRPVVNRIESTFVVKDGLIAEHRDKCSALKWGWQAFGGVKGIAAGLLRSKRSEAAMKKLRSHQATMAAAAR